jgi:hypothetical protein
MVCVVAGRCASAQAGSGVAGFRHSRGGHAAAQVGRALNRHLHLLSFFVGLLFGCISLFTLSTIYRCVHAKEKPPKAEIRPGVAGVAAV